VFAVLDGAHYPAAPTLRSTGQRDRAVGRASARCVGGAHEPPPPSPPAAFAFALAPPPLAEPRHRGIDRVVRPPITGSCTSTFVVVVVDDESIVLVAMGRRATRHRCIFRKCRLNCSVSHIVVIVLLLLALNGGNSYMLGKSATTSKNRVARALAKRANAVDRRPLKDTVVAVRVLARKYANIILCNAGEADGA
jgi:hypothetical protein